MTDKLKEALIELAKANARMKHEAIQEVCGNNTYWGWESAAHDRQRAVDALLSVFAEEMRAEKEKP